MKKNFIEELNWRGMLQDMIPGTEEMLKNEMVKGYIGFDPTADSLGVGNLVQIMTLLHFQNCGHKPIALVGGATGMVGDPSGKSAERNLIDEEQLRHNIDCQKKQLEKFLNFNCGENSAELVNNYDWFKQFNFLEFIRDVGKHLTINYMLSKDSVKNRLENGMSFTEFSYQLIQGYDFYYLWKNHNIKLQMGGSDQWGNIVTGTELIRRKSSGEAFALTTPLIKKSDGTKFGKSEKGNIWLDPNKTSPYAFYQFWFNAADDDVVNYYKIFTLQNKEFALNLINEHNANAGARIIQKELGKELTVRIHGEEEYFKAIKASEILFGKGSSEELNQVDEKVLLSAMEGVLQAEISRDELTQGVSIIDFLTEKTNLCTSKGDAKKMLQNNAISINKNKVIDMNTIINSDNLFLNQYILAQKGKKDYCFVKLVNS